MPDIKAMIFDVDGVMIIPPEMFSLVYAEKYGVGSGSLQDFFKHDFQQALIGKADLKELITSRHDLWHWDKDPQLLLDEWFAAENYPNTELLAAAQKYRQQGMKVYLATNQEFYRTKYLEDVTFPGQFDWVFAAYELGHLKGEPEFWTAVLGKLTLDSPGIQPKQVVYFDDSPNFVETAQAAGILAYTYESNAQVIDILQSV